MILARATIKQRTRAKGSRQQGDLHPEDVDFYTNNFSAMIVSGSEVYTITVKDADLYKTHQQDFYNDKQAAKDTWGEHVWDYLNHIDRGATEQEAGEYALLKMYGDSINLTRQGVNQTNKNVELKLNSSNEVVSNKPPVNKK